MSSNTLIYVAGFERGVRPIGDWSMAISLSRCSSPSIRSCSPGVADAAVQIAAQGLDQNVVDQRALARAGNAGDADERAERNLDVDRAKIVVAAPRSERRRGKCVEAAAWRGSDSASRLFFSPFCRQSRSRRTTLGLPLRQFATSHSALGAARRSRHFDLQLAGQILPGDALRRLGRSPRRCLGHDIAAAHAGAGTEIDDVIGRPHRVFVVLDDDDRVAHVAQLRERVEQLFVVARMQADRRFVEDIEHADQAAADLPGQADALRFAAGKRRRGAVERQILEADVDQEAEPAADFLEHFGGDRLPDRVEFQAR